MAKDSVYSALLKPVAQHGRNTFPLDNNHAFSMRAGHIQPVKAIHFKPADYFDIGVTDFALTFPMNTAPFLRGRKETALYSVYYNAVWSLYNQYIATRQDPKTSAFGVNPYLVEPRIRKWDLYFQCFHQFCFYLYDKYLYRFEITGNVEEDSLGSFHQNWYNLQPALAFTHQSFDLSVTFTDIYDWITNATGLSTSIKGIIQGTSVQNYSFVQGGGPLKIKEIMFDIVGHHRVYNNIRKLDMLGYGNIYPLVRKCQDSIISDFDDIDWTDNTSITNGRASIIGSLGFLLLDLLRCTWDVDSVTTATGKAINPEMVNLYPLCAYNSIFYHFFRNSYYDLGYYNHDYNLDFVSIDGSTLGSTGVVNLTHFSARFLDVEYHQWKKDKFTAVLPDQQFGAVSAISISSPVNAITTGSDVGKWIQQGNPSLLDDLLVKSNGPNRQLKYINGSDYYNIYHSHDVTIPSLTSYFDVIALKRAEMLQEYRQKLMRAGNKTTDIFRALYGEAPSSEHTEDIIPRFLDTFGEDIFIDPVTATADTGQGSNGKLGDLSARGKFKGQSGRIKFNAGGNYGVILVLTYVIPTAEYNSFMTDPHVHELDPESHYLPDFENVGLEDIYSDELNCLLPRHSLSVLGKAPRYHHKKTEVDQVHGAFTSFAATNMIMAYNPNLDSETFIGEFNHWVSPRSDMQNRQNTLLRDLYVNPSVLDNVFVQAVDADQANDQFLCYCALEVRSTKELSKVGLINFV